MALFIGFGMVVGFAIMFWGLVLGIFEMIFLGFGIIYTPILIDFIVSVIANRRVDRLKHEYEAKKHR